MFTVSSSSISYLSGLIAIFSGLSVVTRYAIMSSAPTIFMTTGDCHNCAAVQIYWLCSGGTLPDFAVERYVMWYDMLCDLACYVVWHVMWYGMLCGMVCYVV